jgi:hypothetical protein
LVFGVWCLVFGAVLCLVLGAWCLVLGAWCLVCGVVLHCAWLRGSANVGHLLVLCGRGLTSSSSCVVTVCCRHTTKCASDQTRCGPSQRTPPSHQARPVNPPSDTALGTHYVTARRPTVHTLSHTRATTTLPQQSHCTSRVASPVTWSAPVPEPTIQQRARTHHIQQSRDCAATHSTHRCLTRADNDATHPQWRGQRLHHPARLWVQPGQLLLRHLHVGEASIAALAEHTPAHVLHGGAGHGGVDSMA